MQTKPVLPSLRTSYVLFTKKNYFGVSCRCFWTHIMKHPLILVHVVIFYNMPQLCLLGWGLGPVLLGHHHPVRGVEAQAYREMCESKSVMKRTSTSYNYDKWTWNYREYFLYSLFVSIGPAIFDVSFFLMRRSQGFRYLTQVQAQHIPQRFFRNHGHVDGKSDLHEADIIVGEEDRESSIRQL